MNGSLTSNFSKVQFLDILEAYGIAEPVTFRYTITSNLTPSSNDWIGLYRVGWKSTKEYVTYEWISLPDNYTPGTQVECMCSFKDNLPKNDEDFFQFCYINSQNKVCGASSPFQFLEDYDIVIIDETESMLILETKPCLPNQPTTTADEQLRQPLSDELQIVIRQEEIERITEELTETQKQLMEKDSQLNDLESEVNWLRSKITESEETSDDLAKDVVRLKSELFDEKEKRILVENSFCEIEKRHQKSSSEFNEKELGYQEKETQLIATVQDLQKQLCQKAQEFELLKLDHSSNLSVLDVKQQTVDELNKRCSKMSAEITQLKKMYEKKSKLEMIWKEKEAVYQEQIKHLQRASNGERRIEQMVLEKQIEFHRNIAKDITVTDGIEILTGATAEGGKIQKESSVDKVESNSSSADEFSAKRVMPSKTCRVCSLTFPAGTPRQVICDHLQSHQKVCPMCDKHFELDCTQDAFEIHVSEHLADTIKHTDGLKICPVCQQKFPAAFAWDQFEVHVDTHFPDTIR